MADTIRAALSQPEPAGLSDEELLKALKLAINSFPPAHPDAEGMSCAQYEVTLELRKARAAIAADRAQRQPVPPEPGEVQELVAWLRDNAKDEREMSNGANPASMNLDRVADLLEQRHPTPVPVSERLPDNRDPECVANWPECWSGGYDPRCCRFPKSCSCERGALPLPGGVDHD